MKIRQGFISNSSSSSFSAIGFEVPKDIETKDLLIAMGVTKQSELKDIDEGEIGDFCTETLYQENLIILDEGKWRNTKIFGKVISDISDEGGNQDNEIDLDEILQSIEKCKKKLKIKSKTKIYSGNRMN